MDLNQKAKKLLRNLREAIDQALVDSPNVLAAMGELEDAGFNPELSVDVTLSEESDPLLAEMVFLDEGLNLTPSDESFLETLGIRICS